MGYITVTNTFVDATTAEASEVNQNFTDLVNGTSDGTKDLNVATCSVTKLNATSNVVFGSKAAENWGSGFSVLQFGGNIGFLAETAEGTGNQLSIVNNAYYEAAWKYVATDGKAAQYQIANGNHYFNAVASGTADAALSFTQLMLIRTASVDISSDSYTNAFKVDRTNDKLYSDILKTTQATSANYAHLYVNTDTGEIFANLPA
jgi:hypothetical protein